MSRLRHLLAFGLATAAASTAIAATTFETCPTPHEDQGLLHNYEVACARGSASLQACKEWLRVVKRKASHGDKEAWLNLGATYESLARLSSEPTKAEAYQQFAVRVYRDLIARDPANLQAALGLSALTEDCEEKVRLLRDALAVAPDIFAMQALARLLYEKGGRENTLEAASLFEKAYDTQTRGFNKWYLASTAYSLYLDAGAEDVAAQLRQRVSEEQDVSPLTKVSEDWKPRVQDDQDDPTDPMTVIHTLCSHYALPVVGMQGCVQSIGTMVDHLRTIAPDSDSRELVDSLIMVMHEAGSSPTSQKERPDWQQLRVGWLESLIASGFKSSFVGNAYEMAKRGEQIFVLD